MSNARSIAVHGAYLTEVESELNQAFRRVKTFETLMKRSSNLNFNDEKSEFIKTNRLDCTGNLFNGYELNIGWETTLRRARKLTGQTQLIFGGYHVFIIIAFFGLVGLLSSMSVPFLFGITPNLQIGLILVFSLIYVFSPRFIDIICKILFAVICFVLFLVANNFIIVSWGSTLNWQTGLALISLSLLLLSLEKVLIQFIDIQEWLVTSHFENAMKISKQNELSTECKIIKLIKDKWVFFSPIPIVLFIFIYLIFSPEFMDKVAIFSENRMLTTKQEIISATYLEKIDSILKEQATADSSGLKNDHHKDLAREALEELNKICQNSKQSLHCEQFQEFFESLELRGITGLESECK